jgi:pyrroline-5-carboxylate reductase
MAFPAAPLLLVGGGKMGEALLRGWLARGLPAGEAHVVEPDEGRRSPLAAAGVRTVPAPDDLPPGLAPRALVLAIKPQVMDDAVLGTYRERAGPGTVVVSIAAGKPIALFERVFGPGTAVVRAMPNTPAAVGRGTTVLCANRAAGADARDLAEALMRAVGETHWIDDEEGMHAVTALSGGGPAYVFLLIEALAAAGVRAGLPEGLATALARSTVAGAGELARLSPEPADVLRRNVTSPRGTTEAALRVLMAEEGGLGDLAARAVEAAARRSRELAAG